MVLQQQESVPVWGWGDRGETVTVSFAGQSVDAIVDVNGQWRVDLGMLPSSEQGRQFTVVSTSGDEVRFEDVIVGDVWVCSGQSNMEWPLSKTANADQAIAAADYPQMRLFKVQKQVAYQPQSDLQGEWVVCSPETVKGFSAVAYYFGRHLMGELQRPVGLIASCWGGIVAEAYTSAEALELHLPEFSEEIKALKQSRLASRVAAYEQAMREYEASFPVLYELEDNFLAAAAWVRPNLDDSHWGTMLVPGNWEQNFPGLDGMVWLRKTVDIPASWAGQDLMLHLGPVDEVDVTWFNGHRVGMTGNIQKNEDPNSWWKPREYHVDAEFVNVGANVIAIRAIDIAGEGGLWGATADKMYLAPVDASASDRISLAGEWKIQPQYVLPIKPLDDPSNPRQPTVLYNQMLAPLIPYAMTGVIWYQGESNVDRTAQYHKLLPTLIGDWRHRWQRDFPFLIVQLANFNARKSWPVESAWAELREAQSMTAAKDPKTGIAVTIDIGDAKDIHPKNKQDVGKRLGLVAEAIAYDRDVVANGPTFSKMEIVGAEVILSFDHAEGGLFYHGSQPAGFALCGEDGKFVWADVQVDGNQVRLSASRVPQPVAVRYAWADNPEAPFYNQAGLPMVPFRTDGPVQ
ncbi:sialate O-acetylesterase [Coraliomargarita algicola]|uniref:Sialate O-acetylesterase n=1 Tax=Coraliomargarita algicola TaxID=3092156 RepID=A0ABZ0RGA7_9BACT|nr:sialate O-acetylesterase [Coraliomargarita sp. J2-16]WPJ95057.1 sialate O-acetylesterase [Coraliomargarita sp. J2-16]